MPKEDGWDFEMSDEREIAESYRVRAEEIRTIAEMDGHKDTRERLQRVAQDYEQMAASLDMIADAHKKLRNSKVAT